MNLMREIVLLLLFLAMGVMGGHAKNKDMFISISTETMKLKLATQTSCQPVKQAAHKSTARGMLRLENVLSPCKTPGLTWSDFIKQTLHRDVARMHRMFKITSRNNPQLNSANDVELESGAKFDTGNYIATVGFGTPTQPMKLIIDTGSDITWIQCKPCKACYEQTDPIFDTNSSSTYKPVRCLSSQCARLRATENVPPCFTGTCQYVVGYGDGSRTQGDFAQETLNIGKDTFKKFSFGCGHDNTGLFHGSAGLLGLGRGRLAFPALTRSKYKSQFSYCVPDFGSVKSGGMLSMGTGSIPTGATFTPMISNPTFPTFYMVGLEAITVGRFTISVPAATTIVDSGTVISRLAPGVYDDVKLVFKIQTAGLPSAPAFSLFDTCFNLSGMEQVTVPKITFHYKGNASVDINVVGILVPVQSDFSQVCLALASSPDTINLNIVGNFQQQRMRVAYDGRRKRVGFVAEQCSPPS